LKSIILCSIVILLMIALEFLIKYHLRRVPEQELPKFYCKGRVKLLRHNNHGLVLGIARSHPKLTGIIPLLGLILTLALTITWFCDPAESAWLRLGLALLYAGAIANLLDRWIHGSVLDYISFPRFPVAKISRLVFNLADFSLMAGAILVMITVLLA